MALFGIKKEKDEAPKAQKPQAKARAVAVVEAPTSKPHTVSNAGARASNSDVILRPRITEKASDLSARHNVYTFEVVAGANKNTVAEAVHTLYKVTPLKVRIMPVPRKRVFVRGKKGTRAGARKAYVYLKEGDKIEFV